eukprot:4053283-Pyramimonas_sp.AAC.1
MIERAWATLAPQAHRGLPVEGLRDPVLAPVSPPSTGPWETSFALAATYCALNTGPHSWVSTIRGLEGL